MSKWGLYVMFNSQDRIGIGPQLLKFFRGTPACHCLLVKRLNRDFMYALILWKCRVDKILGVIEPQ